MPIKRYTWGLLNQSTGEVFSLYLIRSSNFWRRLLDESCESVPSSLTPTRRRLNFRTDVLQTFNHFRVFSLGQVDCRLDVHQFMLEGPTGWGWSSMQDSVLENSNHLYRPTFFCLLLAYYVWSLPSFYETYCERRGMPEVSELKASSKIRLALKNVEQWELESIKGMQLHPCCNWIFIFAPCLLLLQCVSHRSLCRVASARSFCSSAVRRLSR